MNIFKIKVWEDEVCLMGHLKKTKPQFEKDFKKALKEVGDDYLASTEWADIEEWSQTAAEHMIKELGYELIEPNFFLIKESGIIQTVNEEWKNLVGDALFGAAVKQNKAKIKSK